MMFIVFPCEYCLLMFIVKSFFGKIRPTNRRHIKDRGCLALSIAGKEWWWFDFKMIHFKKHMFFPELAGSTTSNMQLGSAFLSLFHGV